MRNLTLAAIPAHLKSFFLGYGIILYRDTAGTQPSRLHREHSGLTHDGTWVPLWVLRKKIVHSKETKQGRELAARLAFFCLWSVH